MRRKLRPRVELLLGEKSNEEDVDVQYAFSIDVTKVPKKRKYRKRQCVVCGAFDRLVEQKDINADPIKLLVKYGDCALLKGGDFLICRPCKKEHSYQDIMRLSKA